jgi:ribosomal protein S18 acetylase RimI-like enzyme
MEFRISLDKNEIYSFLSKNPDLNLYTIGDLDDFYWPHTTWFAVYDKNEIQAIALLYSGISPSTFLLFNDKASYYSSELIKYVKPHLPYKFNVHLSQGLIDLFGRNNIIEDYGQNYRMILTRDPENIPGDNIRNLKMSDLDNIYNLYNKSYPFNWFDRRMLETGKYFGYYNEGMLVGIAGIHVYSGHYGIAALGNIATHPDFRGRRIAYKLTSYLCNDLKKTINIIGLNVKTDNLPAIKCYENIGFEIRSTFDECLVQNR